MLKKHQVLLSFYFSKVIFMPIKPQPFKQICKNCHWSEIVAPKSDVLLPNTIKSVCPKCHSTLIGRAELNILDYVRLKLM